MPIDTSMYGNIKPFQVDSPLNALAQVSQVQNAQNQNALAQYTINKAKREDSDTLEVRNALMDTNGDYKAAANALMQRGLYKPAMEIGKAQLEQDKTKSEILKNNASAGETNTKTLNLKLQQHKDMLGPVNDPQSAAAWVTSIYNDPDLGAMMKRTGASAEDLIAKIPTDPAEFQTWKMQSSLSADKLIEYTTPNANTVASNKTSLMTTKMNNDTSRANNAATVAATLSGQNKADARAREANNAPEYKQDADGNWIALPKKIAAGASIVAQPVFGSDGKPLAGGSKMTEDQGKATGWLVQAENAFNNMNNAVKNKPSAAKPGFPDVVAGIPSMGIGGAVGNMMRGTDRQKFMQGSSSLSESLLRAATGAGVNKDEAAQKVRELTPVFGDSDENISQKMAAIPLYIESLKVRAGPGAKKAVAIVNSAKAPNIDDLLKKYGD
jgi:hypothetical protein